MQFTFGRMAQFDSPHVLTIGNFDGVHQGHQKVIAQAALVAKDRKLPLTVLIFEPQPKEYFAGIVSDEAPPRLTTLRSKVNILKTLQVDFLWCLKFGDIRGMSAAEFIDELVVAKNVSHLVIGDDFRFGCDRVGDFELLATNAAHLNFSIEKSLTYRYEGQRISSSRIREALETHDFALAQALLDRPFALTGRVVFGRQLGRHLGFPTANIKVSRNPPIRGVYGCEVQLQSGERYDAIVNIGTRPTLSGQGFWLEAHLHDFNGELYGHDLVVIPRFFIRSERKFETLAQLSSQIALDDAESRKKFSLFFGSKTE